VVRVARGSERRIVTTPVRNVLLGASVAVGLATVAIVPTIAGVATWKWVLAVVGLGLFGRARR
jgi:hypothetical protein